MTLEQFVATDESVPLQQLVALQQLLRRKILVPLQELETLQQFETLYELEALQKLKSLQQLLLFKFRRAFLQAENEARLRTRLPEVLGTVHQLGMLELLHLGDRGDRLLERRVTPHLDIRILKAVDLVDTPRQRQGCSEQEGQGGLECGTKSCISVLRACVDQEKIAHSITSFAILPRESVLQNEPARYIALWDICLNRHLDGFCRSRIPIRSGSIYLAAIGHSAETKWLGPRRRLLSKTRLSALVGWRITCADYFVTLSAQPANFVVQVLAIDSLTGLHIRSSESGIADRALF